MQNFYEFILSVLKLLDPANNAILFISITALLIIGFSLYVLLIAIKSLTKRS